MTEFNLFPNRTFHFKSKLKANEIESVLSENTLIGSRTTSHITAKKFIGDVTVNGFEIISSKSPKHVLCVFSSTLSEGSFTEIEVHVKLHKAFRILFSVGSIALASIILIFPLKLSEQISQLITFVVIIIILRFVLLNFLFDKLAEEGINDLISVLKLEEI